MRPSFMFAIATSVVLGVDLEVLPDGGLLELTGDEAQIIFGESLTLTHNATEDELVCSGKIRAADVVIQGTNKSVADLIRDVAELKSLQDEVRAEMQRVQQRLAAVEGHAACGFATVRELEVRDAEIGEVRRALADLRLGQAESKLAASTQPQIVAAVQALVVDAELRASLDEKVRR